MEFQYYCSIKLLTLFTLVISLLSLAYATNGTCHFPAIFNFGDSNSDTGGLSAALLGQVPIPNGQSYFRGPAGRYSDGRLVIDFMAESLGLPYVNAYLDALGSNFTHGTNFATAGSTISPVFATTSNPFSLNIQYSQFNDFHNRSQKIRDQGGIFKGLMPKAEDFSHALYTFDIGTNDLIAGFFHMTTDQVRAYVPNIVDQLKTIVADVYNNHGGRSFWIHNIGPVGCMPYLLSMLPFTAEQVDMVGCATPYNDVAQFFNLKLEEVIVQLRNDLPSATITYVDIYSVKYELISQANDHGFVNPLQACCGFGGKYNFNLLFFCGNTIQLNGQEIMVGKACDDPSVAISWDGAHYTQAANKWVFDQIVNGSYSHPPIPLKNACYRQ